MNDPWLLIVVLAAISGSLASLAILRRSRRPPESPFAASTEGVKRCPSCGFANVWTDQTCASCETDLPG